MRLPASLRSRPWAPVEIALAGALIAWRCVAPTWHPVYLDLLFYLGLYWILLALRPPPAVERGATLGLMLVGLAIYLKGILPHVYLSADILP